MDKLYNLKIDTKLKTYQKVYGMKQYENNVVLNIQLVQNGMALDLTECTVRLNYQNKNEVLLQMANIIDEKQGKVRVTVLTKVLDTIGDTPVDISVFDEHQKKITSATFVLVVQESIYSNEKIDEEELDLIQDIYSKEKERQEAETQREANEKKREENEEIRDDKIAKLEKDCQECKEEVNAQIHKFDTQEEERKANEIERINNENARKTDEQQRVKQENIREENEKVRVTSETKRVESMGSIEKEWEEIKKDLGSQGGTGDMMKAIYDTNNDGVVDNSEKLGGKTSDEFLQKDAGITWNDINKYDAVKTTTREIKFSLDGGESLAGIYTINDNFRQLDNILYTAGITGGKLLYNKHLSDISETGTYLVNNLQNAPDKPPKNKRWFLVKCTQSDSLPSQQSIHYEITSLGTGKKYTYMNGLYGDIPCTSPVQPQIIYIDYENGDDMNDGTEEMPVKTWECAYSRIPKILTKSLHIHLINVSILTDIELAGLSTLSPAHSDTWLTIDGYDNKINDLNILNCNFGSNIWGICINQVEVISALRLTQSSTTKVSHCKIKYFEVDDGVARCLNNTVANYDATNRAFIQISSHTDHESPHTYGCTSTYGSLIHVSGTHPQGSTGEKSETHGGKVEYES